MAANEIEPADLFWDAFQYVGDEMTPPARDAFEARLEADQSAREAVGQVVHLAQLVGTAEESRPTVERVGLLTPASAVSSAWMQPVGWVAVGAAGCLALVMAFQSLGLVGGLQLAEKKPPVPTNWSSEDLALAWAQTQANDESTAALAASNDVLETADTSSELPLDEAAETAPAWLLAAVAHDSAYDELEN
jgi:hypothetical protein